MTEQRLKNIFADNLRKAMYERGLTMAALSKKAEVSSKAIRKILDGQNNTSMKTVNKLANALAVGPDMLLKSPVKLDEIEDMKNMIEFFDRITANAIECKKFLAKQVYESS